MYDKLLGIFGVLFTFGVAILVHEFGHFVFAKLSRIGVETFSFGFGKKLFKIKWGETTYAIGWIPFGGYVQLKGAVSKEIEDMINQEAAEAKKDQIQNTPEAAGQNKELEKSSIEAAVSEKEAEQEKKKSLTEMVFEDTEALRDKSMLTKIGVFGSGVFFNYLTALAVLTLLFTFGFNKDADFKPVLSSFPNDSYLKNFDFQDGDKILKVEGEPVETWSDAVYAMYIKYQKHISPFADLTIDRNGNQFDVKIPLYADDKYTSGSLGVLTKNIPPIIGDIDKNSAADIGGLKAGDTILSVNNIEVKLWNDIAKVLSETQSEKIPIKVKREDKTEIVILNTSLKADSEKNIEKDKQNREKSLGIYSKMLFDLRPHIPPYIGDTFFNKPAEKAGIRAGDFIIAIDGVEMKSWWDFVDAIQKGKNKALLFKVKRGDKIFETTVKPKISAEDPSRVEVGIISGNPYKEEIKEPFFTALVESVPRSLNYMRIIVVKTAEIFGTMNIKLIQENVGGPIAIGIMSYKIAQRELSDYFFFFVIFNLMLFIMNILPIPVMDGGHILFTLIEGAIRRPIPAKVLMRINLVFVFLLISLAIVVTFNDIIMNIWRIGFGGG